VCGVVGRLVWEKGTARSSRPRLASAPWPRARVIIGPIDAAMDDAITTADLDRAATDGGIRFLGMRDDLEDLYAAMDLYVLALYREGRAGDGSRRDGAPARRDGHPRCRQVVDDGAHRNAGSGGRRAAMPDAVAALATDDTARAAMGRAGREKAHRSSTIAR
jgi:hypothetical protein